MTFLAARWVGKGLWDATFSEDADARDSPDSLETKFAAFGRLIDRDKARIRLAKQPQSPLSAAYRKSPLLRKASALPLLRFVLPAHVGLIVAFAYHFSRQQRSIVGPTGEENFLALMWFQLPVVFVVFWFAWHMSLHRRKMRLGGPETVLMAGWSRSEAVVSARPSIEGLVAWVLAFYGLTVWGTVEFLGLNLAATILILWLTLMASVATLRLLSFCRYDSYELLSEAGHCRWTKDYPAVDLLDEDEVAQWEACGEAFRARSRSAVHIFSFRDAYQGQLREIRQHRAL